MENTNIVIKPADKGTAIVIMDRIDYIQEGLRQLQDPIYYKPLKQPIYMETQTLISDILEDLHKKKFLTKRQIAYLKGDDPPRQRYFYLLPKIHKPQNKWTIPHRIPPGHPIVSDSGSESYGIAEYIDSLTPISTGHTSYIKNTL